MAKPLSENARTVLAYLQAHVGEDIIYTQIAEETGLPPRSVNAIITSALVKRDLAERIVKEGVEKKLIVLTAEGENYDPAADDVEEE